MWVLYKAGSFHSDVVREAAEKGKRIELGLLLISGLSLIAGVTSLVVSLVSRASLLARIKALEGKNSDTASGEERASDSDTTD